MKCECEFGCEVGDECPIMLDSLEDRVTYMIVCEGCGKVLEQISSEDISAPTPVCASCNIYRWNKKTR
ncbi:hypothetical protein LCGC14_2160350 [marine sediment metagenome]|uniref:Uncharacterized protein n=1 Tax=marine sediment metagenome TaxID=412755 RepID=A0A0F9DSU2_9ZZZZ